jgi:hypothetical protein
LAVPLPEQEGVGSQSQAAALRAVIEDLQNIDAVIEDILREVKL